MGHLFVIFLVAIKISSFLGGQGNLDEAAKKKISSHRKKSLTVPLKTLREVNGIDSQIGMKRLVRAILVHEGKLMDPKAIQQQDIAVGPLRLTKDHKSYYFHFVVNPNVPGIDISLFQDLADLSKEDPETGKPPILGARAEFKKTRFGKDLNLEAIEWFPAHALQEDVNDFFDRRPSLKGSYFDKGKGERPVDSDGDR